MLNSLFSFRHNETVSFDFTSLERIFRVDDLIRPRRVLQDSGSRLKSKLLAGLGKCDSQISPVVLYRVLVNLQIFFCFFVLLKMRLIGIPRKKMILIQINGNSEFL